MIRQRRCPAERTGVAAAWRGGLLRGCLVLVLVLALGVAQAQAETATTVPPAVAELLTQVAKATPAQAEQLIDAWKGEAHPLLYLARGQARLHLAQGESEGQREMHLHAAADDFNKALALQPTLRQAHLGLAQGAAMGEDWKTASREVAAGCDVLTADSPLVEFQAQAALRAGDWRLATLAVQEGILRFPDDQQLRRIEVSVLVHAKRTEDAREAILAILAQHPQDAEMWRNLAWAARDSGHEEESLAALEAAMVISPGDPSLRRQLASAQLAAGLPQAAYETVAPVIGDPPRASALADDGLMLLASRAAADGGQLAQARAWLHAVPEHARSRDERLAMARCAVQAGDSADATSALDQLIAAGEHDATVLTWAATLAETRGDSARAEALYLRAISSDQAGSGPAALHLAAFYLAHERRDEARTVLATYLVKKPEDAQAQALLERLNQDRPHPVH